MKRTLEINPSFGEIYRAAGELAARNYRFDDAVGLAREAVALDPTSARAHADLGMHLMRTGDEPQARQALDRAWSLDAYDVVTYNLLALLDTLDKFVEIREGDIILKLDPEEAPVMREYAMPLAQNALKTLSAKYNFTPKGPILIEIFPEARRFRRAQPRAARHDRRARRLLRPRRDARLAAGAAARLVLLAGDALARDGARHHAADVEPARAAVADGRDLGYEETQARPEWATREMEVPYALALERGKTLKLADLNSGFTRPDTIGLAYFQASLLVDHIVRTHGPQKLQALVRSYAEGLEGNAAVEKTIGVSMDQLQASFDKTIDARFGALRAALRTCPASWSPRLPAAGGGAR